jgi:hypothetical protein
MPLLLEDLAEDTAASLGRTADRFDAAAKELARPDAIGDEVARFARHITAYAIAELPRAEAIWQWEADQPLNEQTEVERRLLALQTVFALQARLCVIARRVWKQAESLSVALERGDELHNARWRFERLAHHMKTAIEHRKHGWQPKDSERYAEETRRIAEGKMKTATADEARKWFRPTQPPAGEG